MSVVKDLFESDLAKREEWYVEGEKPVYTPSPTLSATLGHSDALLIPVAKPRFNVDEIAGNIVFIGQLGSLDFWVRKDGLVMVKSNETSKVLQWSQIHNVNVTIGEKQLIDLAWTTAQFL